MTPLLVALGGAVGAALRFVLASRLDSEHRPVGTLAVNLAGSLLLGVIVGLDPADDARALLAVGFCGGLTTYSAFALQAAHLHSRRSGGYVVATLAGTLLAAAAGFWLGTRV